MASCASESLKKIILRWPRSRAGTDSMARAKPVLLAIIIVTSACCNRADNATDVQNAVVTPATLRRRGELICPPASISLPVLSLSCKIDEDCEVLAQLCCNVDGKKRCRKGVPKPTPKPTHRPFIGIVPRECPIPPVIEFLSVKNCTKDSDCWPRICCPEGQRNYCRTPLPFTESSTDYTRLRRMISYFQCTPPPPPIFDLFPKPCRTPIDCLPNLCCQERGKKVCRPPKKSLLALIAVLAQRVG